MKAWITQALPGGKVTLPIKTVAAVVLTSVAIGAIGTAHLTAAGEEGHKESL